MEGPAAVSSMSTTLWLVEEAVWEEEGGDWEESGDWEEAVWEEGGGGP